MSATMKFTKSPQAVDGMGKYGYHADQLFTLGCLEAGCTLLYLIPQTSVLGAMLLTGYLGGAVATHYRVGEPLWINAVMVGVFIWLGLLLREPRLRVLTPIRRR